ATQNLSARTRCSRKDGRKLRRSTPSTRAISSAGAKSEPTRESRLSRRPRTRRRRHLAKARRPQRQNSARTYQLRNRKGGSQAALVVFNAAGVNAIPRCDNQRL